MIGTINVLKKSNFNITKVKIKELAFMPCNFNV